MTPAILFARYSPRPNADECESADHQLQRGRAYCNSHEYEIIFEGSDQALSADLKGCPTLQYCLDLACEKKAILIVTKFDRMARDTVDTLTTVERLRKAGADVASIDEQVNTRGYLGKFFLTQLAAFAEMERARIRERTSQAMQQHQVNGRRMGRTDRCPWGKQADWNGPMLEKRDKEGKLVSRLPARLIDNPAELAILDQIRLKAVEGLGARAITTWLNDQSVPCRGRRWHLTTVRRLLKRVSMAAATAEG